MDVVKLRGKAKSKMIRGIIFLGIACIHLPVLFLLFFALSKEVSDAPAFIAMFFSLIVIVFTSIGLPLFITGLVKLNHYNKIISQQTTEAKRAQGQPVYQKPDQQQAPQQSAPRQIQQTVNQNAQQQAGAEQTQQTNQSAPGGKAPDIDLNSFKALECGVSIKDDKEYKFHRADGFAGSIPQAFIDRTFVKCPVCCSNQPHWTITQIMQMSWKGNLYLFKCEQCGGIISMSVPDVTTLGNGKSGIAVNPNVGLTNIIAKASGGKDAAAVYAVIESVGNSGISPACVGKEFKLEDLQKISLRA